jgi:magnesium-transporting ATPase (P-type)
MENNDSNQNIIITQEIERPRLSKQGINILGFSLIIVFIAAIFFIYCFWPNQNKDNQGKYLGSWNESTSILDTKVGIENRMVILVILGGIIGSLIHAATSFSNFVGEQKLDKSWIWWYVLRPIIGMAVALVFYLVFRGGLLTNTNIESLNVYGIMTLAALAGLFSERATLKLKEIFETLFKPKDDRSGALD